VRKLLVKLYLPTTDKYIINNVAEEFSRLFGGATVIPNCKGYWKNPETDKLEIDNITIIESYTEERKDVSIDFVLGNICVDLRVKLKQKSIAYVVNNEIAFI